MHVCVSICTFRRPASLRRLLRKVDRQETQGLFTCSAVVVDNDGEASARPIVEEFAARARVPTSFVVEPRRGIAFARNAAVRAARGDFIAFIDDDEFPSDGWLLLLYVACNRDGVDGVLGPVLPSFSADAPRWVIDGGFHHHSRHASGTILNWDQTRTGNALVKSSLFAGDASPFNIACVEGSDQEFFRRMIERGHSFRWCDEAIVYEDVPPSRWTRGFLVRRSLFRGAFSVRNHPSSLAPVLFSMLAVPAYAAALPAGLLMGQATFMRSLTRLCYYTGRLLAVAGVDPGHRSYLTE